MTAMARASLKRPAIIAILFLAFCAVAGALVAGNPFERPPGRGEKPALGLFTTLPIYWNEGAEFSDFLADGDDRHWARAQLEHDFVLMPLDVLERGSQGAQGLGPDLGYLLLAQPRALSPGENVALDRWVRGGGQLLLFADPMLTAHSIYAIGDQRRPHDVVLLSPILERWGLRLEFEESQPAGERPVALLGTRVPVDLPGRLALTGAEADVGSGGCRLLADGLAADCAIGAGRVFVLADAALLDRDTDELAAREQAMKKLVSRAFGER